MGCREEWGSKRVTFVGEEGKGYYKQDGPGGAGGSCLP